MGKKKIEITISKAQPVEFSVRKKTQAPSWYQVFLLNDDYTPMAFVIEVLEKFFSMQTAKATQTMLAVHQKGKAICGCYTREIAETKVTIVNECSRINQYPLLCCMEKCAERL
jgi:ATP-dependent Clp protease adaptor protein ClpS